MPSSGSGYWHRISGSDRWCRPRDGSEQRKWLLAPHQRKWPLVQVKKHHQQKWLLAPHQWKLLLMHILPKSQDPEADGGLNNSSAFVDPEAPPSTVGGDRNKNEPTEAERLAQGWCESCVRGRGGCVCGRGRIPLQRGAATLECRNGSNSQKRSEKKNRVSRMKSMKRSAAMFIRAA